MAVGSGVNFAALGKGFVLPLVLGPLVAVALGATLYVVLRSARLKLGVSKEWCVCAGQTRRVLAMPQPPSAFALPVVAAPVEFTVGTCSERYVGSFLGITLQKVMEGAHFASAGVVSAAAVSAGAYWVGSALLAR